MKMDIKRLKEIFCKKRPFLDIGYEELQNFIFVQSDEEE